MTALLRLFARFFLLPILKIESIEGLSFFSKDLLSNLRAFNSKPK